MLVVKDSCIKCGECKRVCPTKIIGLKDKPFIYEGSESRCIKCGHCEAVCPVNALENKLLPQDEVFEKLPPLTKVQVESAIANRFSSRFFKSEQIEKEDLDFLLNMARHSPSGKNTQGLKFLVIRNKESLDKLKNKIIELALQNPEYARMAQYTIRTGNDIAFYNAPCLIIVLLKKNRFNNVKHGEYALSYIDLFAPSVNLGTCFCGFLDDNYQNHKEDFKELLHFDDNEYDYVGSILIGRPDSKHYRSTKRNPLDVEYK